MLIMTKMVMINLTRDRGAGSMINIDPPSPMSLSSVPACVIQTSDTNNCGNGGQRRPRLNRDGTISLKYKGFQHQPLMARNGTVSWHQ